MLESQTGTLGCSDRQAQRAAAFERALTRSPAQPCCTVPCFIPSSVDAPRESQGSSLPL